MENPICSMDSGKFDQCSPSSTTVVCEKDRVSFDYGQLNNYHPNSRHTRHNNMMNKNRWIMPYCTVAAIVIALGSLIGLVAVYVELRRADTVLATNRELIHAQDLKILNQTNALNSFRTELKYIKGSAGGTGGAPNQPQAAGLSGTAPETGTSSSSSRPGGVYVHWGVDDCPSTSTMIYAGVAASGSSLSLSKGSGGNYMCMTSEPEYGTTVLGNKEPRAKIYGVEYRNGRTFGDMSDLHGHDVPCASCLTGGGRQAVLMIPGKASCPTGWTKEYYGILMSSRYNNVRTSYICVDIDAESRPGTMTEDGNSSLLFPVVGICGTGGGLPCAPYVNEKELQCVFCSK